MTDEWATLREPGFRAAPDRGLEDARGRAHLGCEWAVDACSRQAEVFVRLGNGQHAWVRRLCRLHVETLRTAGAPFEVMKKIR